MNDILEYPRLGHGPFGKWNIWPIWPVKYFFYDPRPDLHKSKTRAPQWALLHSESRYLQALFCWIGPPSHILWNIKVRGNLSILDLILVYMYRYIPGTCSKNNHAINQAILVSCLYDDSIYIPAYRIALSIHTSQI